MKENLELIIKSLVKNKEEVTISEELNNNFVQYTVKVKSEDMGRVIGKEGKVAKAIRTLMKSLANAEKKVVSVKFVD